MDQGQYITTELEMQLLNTLSTRKAFWTERFTKCHCAGVPDLHVSLTRRINEFLSADEQGKASIVSDFRVKNGIFLESVESECMSQLQECRSGLDLGCGPGLWTAYMLKYFSTVYAVDIVPDIVEYVHQQFGRSVHAFSTSAANFVQQLPARSVDVVFMIREALHWPEPEWNVTMKHVQRIAKFAVICEMLKDDIPRGRAFNPGTWYWTKSAYDKVFEGSKLVHYSQKIMNENDPCRLFVWRMRQ